MSAIRTTLLSIVLVIVIGVGAYLAAVPLPAMAASSVPASCPLVGASSFSTQQLWDMLNARYERRVGLPR